MSNKNEVFEYLIAQLRQQVNNNQCEDLAHEVQSLKNQLARYKKPYIAYVKKTDWVQGDSRFLKKWGKHRADILRECIQEQDAELQSLKNQLRDASAQIKELHKALVQATGDVEAYKLIRKGEHGAEQSGCSKEDTQAGESWTECDGYGACPVPDDTVVDIKFRSGEVESNTKALWWRWGATGGLYDIVAYRAVKRQCHKEDTQECFHNWRFVNGKAPAVCINCGVTKSSECEHEWQFYGVGFPRMCIKCGLKK